MTDPDFVLDDRQPPDLIRQARDAFTDSLAAAGGSRRAPGPAEDAVLVASALVVDELVARLNQVGERFQRPLLALLGLRPRAASVARTHVRIWFDEPLARSVTVPRDTEVATSDDIRFTATRETTARPASMVKIESGGTADAIHLGFAGSLSDCVVALTTTWAGAFDVHRDLRVSSWNGESWIQCRSQTGSRWRSDRAGVLLVELPAGHAAGEIGGVRAYWLRLTRAAAGTRLPSLDDVVAGTVGATFGVVHAHRIVDEPLGVYDGDQPALRLTNTPVSVDLPDQVPTVETDDGTGWQSWTVVHDFADSGPADRHALIDPYTAEVRFGAVVREADGTVRRYGRQPENGAVVRVRSYWHGGGSAGNVDKGAICRLTTPLPISGCRIENLYRARGGGDSETVAQLWRRAPLALQSGGRAVTYADFEYLARAAAPTVARAHCVGVGDGSLRLLVVPSVTDGLDARPTAESLRPHRKTLADIAESLDRRRLMGVRLVVEPPVYQGVSVSARIEVAPGADQGAVVDEVLDALYAYLHPITGGRDGEGWPFGHPVRGSEIVAVMHRVDRVAAVHDVRLTAVDVATGRREAPGDLVTLAENALVLSTDHDIRVGHGR